MDKLQIPGSKHKAPGRRPRLDRQPRLALGDLFGPWPLDIGHSLVFGSWCLVFPLGWSRNRQAVAPSISVRESLLKKSSVARRPRPLVSFMALNCACELCDCLL